MVSSTTAATMKEEEEEEEDEPIVKFGKGARDSMWVTQKKNTTTPNQKRSTATTVGSTSTEIKKVPHEELTHSADSQGQVQFGKVRVHKHRMTLGDNPEALGAPVTLGWDVQESAEFGDLDSYEASEGSSDLKRLTKNRRNKIAEQNHSRKSIQSVISESDQIKLNREESEREDIRRALVKEEKERKRQQSIMGRLFQRGKNKK